MNLKDLLTDIEILHLSSVEENILNLNTQIKDLTISQLHILGQVFFKGERKTRTDSTIISGAVMTLALKAAALGSDTLL